jgi:hypothetical protein
MMRKPKSRTWTLEERLEVWQLDDLTEEERTLARRLAEAWHFFMRQRELPVRCSQEHRELDDLDMGILQVTRIREGRHGT